MHRKDIDHLDPGGAHWAVAVVAPVRDWSAAPGCRVHARFLVDGDRKRPSRSHFERFDSRSDCLEWIMANRRELADRMPGATIRPVQLASWLIGLS